MDSIECRTIAVYLATVERMAFSDGHPDGALGLMLIVGTRVTDLISTDHSRNPLRLRRGIWPFPHPGPKGQSW